MNREELNDKALQEVFRRISTIPLPENLNKQIMQKVQKARRRREIRNILIVAFTSVIMLISTCYVLIHYLGFNPAGIFSSILKKPENLTFSGFTPLLCIIIPSLLLLWIDYRFRKHFKNLQS